jgi:hypothetical protein
VKYLFVLALFAVAAFMLYWRMRPFIRGVRRFLGVVREVNRMNAGAARQQDLPRRQQKSAPGEKLVRCAACGTWMPASRAVTLRAAGATYCSHSCLERAADAPHKARKSAS